MPAHTGATLWSPIGASKAHFRTTYELCQACVVTQRRSLTVACHCGPGTPAPQARKAV